MAIQGDLPIDLMLVIVIIAIVIIGISITLWFIIDYLDKRDHLQKTQPLNDRNNRRILLSSNIIIIIIGALLVLSSELITFLYRPSLDSINAITSYQNLIRALSLSRLFGMAMFMFGVISYIIKANIDE